MEVPNPLHHNNYMNSKLSNSEPEDPSYSADCKCISSYDVNRKNYNSDSTLSHENRRARKDQLSPLRSDSNPYITPKFHLRRKEELPSVTPHWSNSKGMELKETVQPVLNDGEYSNSFERTKSFIRSGGGSRISSYTNSQTGPYTPPQFFFSPQKYIETSRRKDDILVSIDNKIPPSLQSWANQRPLQNQENRELQEIARDVENEKSIQRLREHRVKDSHKVKLAISDPRSKQFHNNERHNKSEGYRGSNTKSSYHEKSQTTLKSRSKELKHSHLAKNKHNFPIRGNEDLNNSCIKRYKKLLDKSRSTTSHATEAWRQVLDHKLNEKLKCDDKKIKQVYGNDTWRQKNRVVPKQEEVVCVDDKEADNKRNVYGNETWKHNITSKIKEPKKKVESEQPATKSKRSTAFQMEQKVKPHKAQEKAVKGHHRATSMIKHQNDHNDEYEDNEDQQATENENRWEDIEPYLPSFLSTANREIVKDQKKPAPPPQQEIPLEKAKTNKKKENNKSKGSMSASVDNKAKEGPLTKVKRAYRCFFNPVNKNKNQEESISLFKHFQTRSKMLRKQHSMLGKKKAEVLKNPKRALSAKNVMNYYISQCEFEDDENDASKKKEEEQSFRSGTVCDIDDDGFKVSHSNIELDFVPSWQTENKTRIDSLLGCDGLFGL